MQRLRKSRPAPNLALTSALRFERIQKRRRRELPLHRAAQRELRLSATDPQLTAAMYWLLVHSREDPPPRAYRSAYAFLARAGAVSQLGDFLPSRRFN